VRGGGWLRDEETWGIWKLEELRRQIEEKLVEVKDEGTSELIL